MYIYEAHTMTSKDFANAVTVKGLKSKNKEMEIPDEQGGRCIDSMLDRTANKIELLMVFKFFLFFQVCKIKKLTIIQLHSNA